MANIDKMPTIIQHQPISTVCKNYGLIPVIFCTIKVQNLHLLTVYHKRFGLSGVLIYAMFSEGQGQTASSGVIWVGPPLFVNLMHFCLVPDVVISRTFLFFSPIPISTHKNAQVLRVCSQFNTIMSC